MESQPLQNYEQLRARIESLTEIGRWREASKLVQQALLQFPNSASLLCQLAVCHLQLGNETEALKYADKAIQADPEEEWGFRLRSILLLSAGKKPEALEAAQSAVQLDSHNLHTLFTLAQAQAANEQFAEARLTAELLREIAPEAEMAHNLLGEIALKQACWREAEGHLRRALQLHPNSYQAMNNLGLAVLRQGQNEEATEYFFQAAKLNPQGEIARENFSHTTRQFRLPGIIAVTALWVITRLMLHLYLNSLWRSYLWSSLLTLLTAIIFTISFYGYPSLNSPEFRSLSENIQEFLRADWRRERIYYWARGAGGLCLLAVLWWLLLWGITGANEVRPRTAQQYFVLALLTAGAVVGIGYARKRYRRVWRSLLKTIAEVS